MNNPEWKPYNPYEDDKNYDYNMLVSDCCGASDCEISGGHGEGWVDVGICPKCREHCEFVEESEE